VTAFSEWPVSIRVWEVCLRVGCEVAWAEKIKRTLSEAFRGFAESISSEQGSQDKGIPNWTWTRSDPRHNAQSERGETRQQPKNAEPPTICARCKQIYVKQEGVVLCPDCRAVHAIDLPLDAWRYTRGRVGQRLCEGFRLMGTNS